VVDAPAPGGLHVRQVDAVDLGDEVLAVRAPPGVLPLRDEPEVVACVALGDGVPLDRVASSQAPCLVRDERVQHEATGGVTTEERRVDERQQRRHAHFADDPGRLACPGAVEDGERQQRTPLVGAQQRPGVLEHGAQAAVPLVTVPTLTREQVETRCELRLDLVEVEDPQPRRRELEGQGQAVDEGADPRDLGERGRRGDEVGPDAVRRAHEQGHRVGRCVVASLPVGHPLQVDDALAAQAEAHARRRQDRQLRGVRLELREEVARVPDQMFDVVEHEEHLQPSQVSADVLGRRGHALGCTDSERHGRGHGLRRRRRREVDVPRPVAERGRATRPPRRVASCRRRPGRRS
jgi:hypothetical protein